MLAAALSLSRRARAEEMRDGLIQPGAPYAARPAAGGFDFIPPPSPEDIQTSFWEAIRRLQQKSDSYGNQDSQRLVAQIRRDMASLGSDQRLAVMTRFLEISFHYRSQHNPDNPPEVQAAHEAAFFSGIRTFQEMARREQEESNNSAYMNLFSEIRQLAASGPEGLKISKELAKLDPKNPGVQRQLAQDQLQAGNFPAAAEASLKAIELDGSFASAFTTLAGAKYQMGDSRGAHQAAEEALRVQPQDQLAFSILKLTEGNMQLPPAPKERGLSEAPSAPQAASAAPGPLPRAFPQEVSGAEESRRLTEAASAEIAKGDYDAAAEFAARAARADPASSKARYWSGVANMRSGRLLEALSDTDAAFKLLPGDRGLASLMLLRAEILNRFNRHSEALEAADRGLAASPQSAQIKAELLFQKAWALAGLRRRGEAAKALASAAHLDSRFEPYYRSFMALPEEADWTALFKGALLTQPQTPASGWERWGRPDARKMMLTLVLSSLVGGLLIALGLLEFMRPSLWSRRLGEALADPPPAQGPPPAVPLPAPEGPGSVLADTYSISRTIGTGGMGIVFEALDRNLDRRVAIKKLRPEISSDRRARERILQEARTVAQLRHPNILEIYSVVSNDAGIYLVFEFIDGTTLHEHIQRSGRLSFAAGLGILRDVAAALEYSHRRGIIHRDLKPSNVMIDRDGVVKVMDFGVARSALDELGRRAPLATACGTPQYMAPEQEQGNPRKESDVYAMGVTLYEMVTGQRPFAGSSSGISLSKMNGQYIPPSRLVQGLPEHFDRVLSWALAPDPAKRWRSPGQFLRNLEALVQRPPGSPMPPEPSLGA